MEEMISSLDEEEIDGHKEGKGEQVYRFSGIV